MLGTDQELFGIRTLPEGPPSATGVVILNAGLLHHVGPFRLHVDLAEQLAQTGFAVTRLDQSGKGESPRRAGLGRSESMLVDYDDALADLRQHGVEQAVLVGLCSGADDASYISTQRDSVAGIVSLDGFAEKNLAFYRKKYAPKLLSPAAWLKFLLKKLGLRSGKNAKVDLLDGLDIRDWPEAAEILGRYVDFLGRGGKLLQIYTDGQNYYNHAGQFTENLPSDCELSNLHEVFFDDADHTYTLTAHRRRLVELISDWAGREFAAKDQEKRLE
jgi:pimeloyl-ACP methyl ester carboxylesterase